VNKYKIYWLGFKRDRIFGLLRPSGTTGSVSGDCALKCYSMYGNFLRPWGFKEIGTAGELDLDDYKKIIIEKKRVDGYKQIDIEEAKKQFPEFFLEYEKLAIIHTLKNE
jgi:hypothetical protein